MSNGYRSRCVLSIVKVYCVRLIAILFSIAPIFLIVVLGCLLPSNGIPNFEFWNLNDKLVYWVLIPALLFHKASTSEIFLLRVGTHAIVILSGFLCALIFTTGVAHGLGFAPPSISSIMPGVAPHKAFIAQSIADRVFGSAGLSLAALATAILASITNLTIVLLMAFLKLGEH